MSRARAGRVGRLGRLTGVAVGWVGLALSACGGATESEDDEQLIAPEGDGTTTDGERQGGESLGTPAPVSGEACPCSRRPGANNSFMCAMGVGETMTQRVGLAGGQVALQAQQGTASGVDFRIDVPPNSWQEDLAVRITETAHAPPAGLVDYSPIYRVEPTDVDAQFPMRLRVPFGGNDGELPGTLAIYVAADPAGPFERIPDSYINAGFLQGSTTRFGAFIAASPRTPELAACP